MEVERVQSIAYLSKCMDTIPVEFIRAETEQPAITSVHGEVLEVPVVNIGGDGSEDEENVVRLVAEAASKWGLFQVLESPTFSRVPKIMDPFGFCF